MSEDAPFSNKTASATSSSDVQVETCKEQKLRRRKRQAALDFGSCSDPTIKFADGLDGRKEASFAPNSDSDFNHGSALNIAVISGFICQQLNDKCKAAADAVAACEKGKEAAANAKGQDAADASNAARGGNGGEAAQEEEEDVTCDDGASTTTSASSAAAVSSTDTMASDTDENDDDEKPHLLQLVRTLTIALPQTPTTIPPVPKPLKTPTSKPSPAPSAVPLPPSSKPPAPRNPSASPPRTGKRIRSSARGRHCQGAVRCSIMLVRMQFMVGKLGEGWDGAMSRRGSVMLWLVRSVRGGFG